MTHFSDFEEQQQAIAVELGANKAAFQTWVALYTVAPDDAGAGGTEVSGGSYARVRVFQDGVTSPYWTRVGSLIQNTGIVTWPQASADWGELQGMAILDASTAGNFRFIQTLPAPFGSVLNGQVFQIADGVLKVSFD